MQITVESCQSICMSALQKEIRYAIEKEKLEFKDENAAYELFVQELNKFSVNGQTFKYISKENYLGGYRWFFLCPKCNKRANKLFLPPVAATSREQKYLCKACHKLKNQSSLVGSNQLYKAVMRPLKRLKDIEDRIARGHLKSEKIQSLLDEYELIESRLKESQEYRLYDFKRKHGL